MPRLTALYAEWKRHPPLPVMVAAYLGFKPETEGTPDELVQRIQGLSVTQHCQSVI